jgi:hypothetical protein
VTQKEEEQARLHELCDISVVLARAELLAQDRDMKITMRALRAVARDKIRMIERPIVARKKTEH